MGGPSRGSWEGAGPAPTPCHIRCRWGRGEGTRFPEEGPTGELRAECG